MQEAVIRRVDAGLGVLLELRPGIDAERVAATQNGKPEGGSETVLAGYAHISAVSDKRVEKLEKVWAHPVSHMHCQVALQGVRFVYALCCQVAAKRAHLSTLGALFKQYLHTEVSTFDQTFWQKHVSLSSGLPCCPP